MRSAFTANHFKDENGNPAGGTTFGQGFAIGWQNGPLGRGEDRKEPNGAFVEDIIAVALDRIEFYQDSPFACEANASVWQLLQAALDELQKRAQEREQRAVEGTHQV